MSTTEAATIGYAFTGLMAPVFTAFDDDDGSVRTVCIDAYAEHLHANGVDGVLVNGTTGEGPALRLDERLRLAEHWLQASRRHGLSMMLQIGGAALPDVLRMAVHADTLGVDAVLLLPELYFRPRSEMALVEYCRLVAEHCSSTPLLYYHIPAQTGVNCEFVLSARKQNRRATP